MTREINTHKNNPCNENIKITVEDLHLPEDTTNEHRRYVIERVNTQTNLAYREGDLITDIPLYFQKGHCDNNNNNGLTFEVLAAIIIDTAEMFQKSSLATPETEEIIKHAQAIIDIGRRRYEDRLKRNVYDTREI